MWNGRPWAEGLSVASGGLDGDGVRIRVQGIVGSTQMEKRKTINKTKSKYVCTEKQIDCSPRDNEGGRCDLLPKKRNHRDAFRLQPATPPPHVQAV